MYDPSAYYLGPQSWPTWARAVLPYSRKFRFAGYSHDVGYGRGGNSDDRRRVDALFLRMMLAVCDSRTQRFFAYAYYSLVRIFGWAFFRRRETLTKPDNP